jgi:hypothetical protein
MTETGQPGEGWWLASDGNWYPPESRPAPPPPPAPPSHSPQQYLPANQQPWLRPLSRGLTGTLVGFLWAAAAAYAATAVTYYLYWSAWRRWNPASFFLGDSARFTDLLDAENLANGMAAIAGLLFIVAVILFIIWSNHAYKTARSLGPTQTKWSPGWAVGGWFIPFANLIIPKQVLGEVERIADPRSGPAPIGDRWKTVKSSGLGIFWWILWVAANVAYGVRAGFASAADGINDDLYGMLLVVTALAMSLVALAGVGGALHVSTVGRDLAERTRWSVPG